MKLTGSIELKGDKSISHRAIIIASLIDDHSIIKNISLCDDVKATINCLKKCNVQIDQKKNITDIKVGKLK